MQRFTIHVFLLTFLLGASLGVPCPALAWPGSGTGADQDEAAADELFRRGAAAFDAGKVEQAYELLLSAWKLKQTHDIAGNLGQVELKLGKNRDAAEHVAFALAHFPPSVAEHSDRRQKMKAALDGLRKKLGVLRILVRANDAKITLDGVPVVAVPLGDEVFVDPGPHVIEATLTGYRPAQVHVDASKGTEQEVSLALVPLPPVPPPVPAVKRTWRPNTALLVTGGVLAASGLVTGTALTVAANHERRDADALAAMLPQGSAPVCAGTPAPSTATTCNALRDAAASRDALSRGAVAGFVLGGALGVATAGLGWWAVGASNGARRGGARLRVLPFATASSGGVVLTVQ